MYPDVLLCIDGRWTRSADGRTIPVVNPATEEIIGSVAHAGPSDLDAALAAAEKGFMAWRQVSAYERSKVMRRAAALLRERLETIAQLMTLEQGKPVAQARLETGVGADIIDWMAEAGRRAYGRVVPGRAANVQQLVIKEPVGPVAAFSPWNFPINQAVRKISAALAAGCSIILKAPEETPASPAELVRCFIDAGVPAGAVNLVFGVPADISSYLIGNRGYFFEPTVLTGAPIEARAMNEEPFGPLALMSSFTEHEEAMAEANRLPYGLAAYVFTRSQACAQAAIAGIEAGMVSVNHYGLALSEVPFGGIKDSGYGSEGGSEAIEPYFNTKFASVAS